MFNCSVVDYCVCYPVCYPPSPSQILVDSDLLGSKRNFGKANFYKNFYVSFRLSFSLKETLFFKFKYPSFNIIDTETINKLRQDKSAQIVRCSGDFEAPDIMFICSMVYYCTHTYIEAARYIFLSKIGFCASVVQITDLRCKVKINSDFFVSLFGMFWEVMFRHSFRCFIYLQDLKVFYQRKGHICYCFRITEFISRM